MQWLRDKIKLPCEQWVQVENRRSPEINSASDSMRTHRYLALLRVRLVPLVIHPFHHIDFLLQKPSLILDVPDRFGLVFGLFGAGGFGFRRTLPNGFRIDRFALFTELAGTGTVRSRKGRFGHQEVSPHAGSEWALRR